MELSLKIKTDEKTKENSKNFFLKLCIVLLAILVVIIYLINARYNFYIGISSKKEMIEVNAVNSNQLENE